MTERLTGDKFLELLKAAEGKCVTTDPTNQEIILWSWEGEIEGDEESGRTVTYYGPDPDKTDFLLYMEFLAELHKHMHLRDFVVAYIFGRLEGK